MTFIATLRVDRVSAPWVIDGPINAPCLCRKMLAPELKPGDIVVMDNLGWSR
ncbi:Mobile element protein (plasmid) [Sinorhizobium sp. CCBAU 05631]|nr:Mobile element protein [Sinorhizobium sp. CCBAU 05631]ASY74115.1 Mobile element protein [Sinorhizobium fredii CCBAU 83666]